MLSPAWLTKTPLVIAPPSSIPRRLTHQNRLRRRRNVKQLNPHPLPIKLLAKTAWDHSLMTRTPRLKVFPALARLSPAEKTRNLKGSKDERLGS